MTACKLDDDTRKILLTCAKRGLPKRLCARIAGVDPSTFHKWLKSEAEPYASFAVEWHKHFASAGAALVDSVAATDPKYLLGAVFKIKATEKREISGKLEVKDDLARLSEAELEARMRKLGYVRADVPAEETDDGDHEES